MSFLSKIFGDANQRKIKSYEVAVQKINELEPQFERFSHEELRDKSQELRARLKDGETPDNLLPEAFAAVREAAKRTLGQRHFDVQLMGGVALHEGKIAEMRTGEGKTLVATLPAYLNALTGKGVHVVTVNDYLSRRDTVWMGQIFHLLGLSVGCINHESSFLYDPLHRDIKNGREDENPKFEIRNSKKNQNSKSETASNFDIRASNLDRERDTEGSFRVVHEFLRPVTRREAYEADITYGTNNEFGFDYLRDNMSYDLSQISQAKSHHFAIVDEVDSILIDEARTPLIISAPDADSTKLYETFARIVPRLKENEDYNIDEKLRAVSITEGGIEKVEKVLNLKNIYEEGGTRYVHHMEQALRANVLFRRDKDYVVKNGEVIIVDEFTGRLMPGRRWSEGLHQAVEAKEGVYVQKESRTMATITFQNYFRLYSKLAGMTGTAQTSAEEFHKVYNIDVLTIPTNKSMIREDKTDRIYKTEAGKFRALVAGIKERHLKGQPVLVGTASIQHNEVLSTMLEREGLPHKVLNAKNHEQEGAIIAQAGRLGAVTVATNMAGRGVDIILGGNPPNADEAGTVRELGGLHVIGTERHEARRIDNQLRGRAGRQGDPGSSQFFVSTEDEVIRIFGGDRLKNLMDTLGVGEDDVIENRFISRAIEQAQSKIEGHNFDIRKHVLEYDDVMNRHRTAIYKLRHEVLESTDSREKVLDYVRNFTDKIIQIHTTTEGGHWNTEEIAENLKALTGIQNGLHEKSKEFSDSVDIKGLEQFTHELIDDAYAKKENEVGAEAMRHLEKMVLLRVIDELWVDHLEQMEYLRDSVRLRAYGQRDPLVEYKIEGQKMFNQLQETIGAQVAGLIFKVGFVKQESRIKSQELRESGQETTQGLKTRDQSPNSPALDHSPSSLSGGKMPGRNDPCPCGSGKKYKRCHGR